MNLDFSNFAYSSFNKLYFYQIQIQTNSNQEIVNLVEIELNKGKRERRFLKISDRIKERAVKLLEKAIRRAKSDPTDPLAEALMETPQMWNLPEIGENRVGGPRTNWAFKTAGIAWDKCKLYERTTLGTIAPFDHKIREHVQILIQKKKSH